MAGGGGIADVAVVCQVVVLEQVLAGGGVAVAGVCEAAALWRQILTAHVDAWVWIFLSRGGERGSCCPGWECDVGTSSRDLSTHQDLGWQR